MKPCTKCGHVLALDRFNIRHERKRSGDIWTGRESACKDCNYAKHRKWVMQNPERTRELDRTRNKRNLDRLFGRNLRKYQLTVDEYNALNASQDGFCAICRQPEKCARKGLKSILQRLAVDHDHTTGAVRGLLCSNCNRAIGQLGDDPTRLRAAATYLEKHGVRNTA